MYNLKKLQEDKARVAQQYRSVDELREDFKKITANMKTDVQVLAELVEELKSGNIGHGRLLVVLEDIEYYSHQIDNGVELVKMEAIPILLKFANESSSADGVADAALLSLGSAMQNNLVVQQEVLAKGGLGVIYNILNSNSPTSFSTIHSRALYALSALLRRNSPAQEKFAASGGFSLLRRLFPDLNEKLSVKVVSLVGDLVAESDEDDSNFKTKDFVIEGDWCSLAARLFTSNQHNTREKAIRFITQIVEDCKARFDTGPLQKTLQILLSEYGQLAEGENKLRESHTVALDENNHDTSADTGEDDYFNRMFNSVHLLLAKFESTTNDEL